MTKCNGTKFLPHNSISLTFWTVFFTENIRYPCKIFPVIGTWGTKYLRRLLTVQHILKKVMSMQHSFEEFSEKQRRVELKSVGNFIAKAVLVESANQFSLEELCRTQYSLKYFFRSHIDQHTYGKTLSRWYDNNYQSYHPWHCSVGQK